jgi:O-antigen ligase
MRTIQGVDISPTMRPSPVMPHRPAHAATPGASGTGRLIASPPAALETASPAVRVLLVLGLALAATGIGLASATQPPTRVLLMLGALLALPLILAEWRIGVVLLALVLPSATMLPPIRGLNPVNVLTVATLGAFALHAMFGRTRVVALPGGLWWGLALPAALALAIAWPHIPEGVRNYPLLADARAIYHPPAYAMDRLVRPLFHWFSFAFLVANAVRASQRPERFIALAAAALVLPALAVFWSVATYPGGLDALLGDREFMAARGMHANEFGMQLALAAAPLLFVAGATRSPRWRALALAGFTLAAVAMLLTLSRGALLALLIAVGGFLWHHRRVKTIVAALTLALLALLAAPQALQERFGTGLRAGALGDTAQVEHDELTAGRVHGWLLLAPQVLDSPLIGRGLGSTQWSDVVAAGHYKANHPHNIYLELLMDLGLIGLAAVAAWHWRIVRQLRLAHEDPTLGDELRGWFLGLRWAFLGALAMAATTAYYMPNAAQAPWWFGLGMLFAFWRVPSPAVTEVPR